MYDFISIGEMLIDFSPFSADSSAGREYPLYQLNPGGAPANVACVTAKLGLRSAFIGKVGRDSFGSYCKKALDDAGCDSSHLILSPEYGTSLAFVSLTPDGDRSFSFYRNETTADVNLSTDDLSEALCTNTRIFHFGSVSLTQEPSRSATLAAVRIAKNAGRLISYDPNLRLPLWKDAESAKRAILEAMPLADLVKISEEEQEFLFPGLGEDEAAKQLAEAYGISLLVITKAKNGCVAFLNEKKYIAYAYDVKTIDTTGAGDAFWAGLLLRLLERGKPVAALADGEVDEILAFANAMGSLVTTRLGAIAAIPTRDAVEHCMRSTPLLR